MSIFTLNTVTPPYSGKSSIGTNTMRGTILRNEGKVFVGPRVCFDKDNIEKTAKIESQNRTYGFKRAHASLTPYPKMLNIDNDELMNRLRTAHMRLTQERQDKKQKKVKETQRSVWVGPKIDENISFAERRKRFYQAEYTITQGIKLDELQCKKATVVDKPEEEHRKSINSEKSLLSTASNGFSVYNDIEVMAQRLNIKLTHGFDY